MKKNQLQEIINKEIKKMLGESLLNEVSVTYQEKKFLSSLKDELMEDNLVFYIEDYKGSYEDKENKLKKDKKICDKLEDKRLIRIIEETEDIQFVIGLTKKGREFVKTLK